MSGHTGTTWTREQAMDSLAIANHVRERRKIWKAEQKGRRKDEGLDALISLIAQNPTWAYSWRLSEVLRACPGIGLSIVRQAITCFGVGFNHQTRIGSLTERQRDVVMDWAERQRTTYLKRAATRR